MGSEGISCALLSSLHPSRLSRTHSLDHSLRHPVGFSFLVYRSFASRFAIFLQVYNTLETPLGSIGYLTLRSEPIDLYSIRR